MLYNIYKLVSDSSDLVYVGRTVRTLTERFTQHRNHSTRKDRCSSWKVLEHGNCSIIFIEETEDKEREKYWIDELGACNTNKLTRDDAVDSARYREKNREKLREYARRNNALKVMCDICGSESSKGNLRSHQKSKRCRNYSTTSNIE